MSIFITQKKRPDALNAKQKTPALYNVPLLKKIKKNCQNAHFFSKLPFFAVFFFLNLLFIQERYIAESWGLLRQIQCIRLLLLSYQNQHLHNFSKFPSSI